MDKMVKSHTVKSYTVSDMQPGAALKKMTGSKEAKSVEPHMIPTTWNCCGDMAAPAGKRKGY